MRRRCCRQNRREWLIVAEQLVAAGRSVSEPDRAKRFRPAHIAAFGSWSCVRLALAVLPNHAMSRTHAPKSDHHHAAGSPCRMRCVHGPSSVPEPESEPETEPSHAVRGPRSPLPIATRNQCKKHQCRCPGPAPVARYPGVAPASAEGPDGLRRGVARRSATVVVGGSPCGSVRSGSACQGE